MVNGDLQVRDDPDKKLVARAIYILIIFVLFSFERHRQNKTKAIECNIRPHQEIPIPKAKDNHFENAIDFVWERFLPQVTEPRRRPVRWPGPSQIKMYGFCRLFRAMVRL